MASSLRHGFKAESERISLSVRAELHLSAHDPLDCFALSEHLGVPIISLVDLQQDGARLASITRLLDEEAGFSALTVCAGSRRLVVYNPNQPPGRCANSLAHELAHILLEHPPLPALDRGGCRRWDARLEEEADWQAGALLVPRDGLLAWLRRGDDPSEGARFFGVSWPLFRWRMTQTGVTRQIQASARRNGLVI